MYSTEQQITANQDDYDVKYYSLDLTPDPATSTLTGQVEVVAEVISPSLDHVELSVFNILGEKVATLVSERKAAGAHQVEWDATDFASGIYYYQIRTGEFQAVRKMILLR